MNGKKRDTRTGSLVIWLLMEIPWNCSSCPLPCLQGYSGFAKDRKSDCLCTAGQAVPRYTLKWRFLGMNKLNTSYKFQVQARRREEVSRWPQNFSEKPTISMLPWWLVNFHFDEYIKTVKIIADRQGSVSHGEIPVILGSVALPGRSQYPGTTLKLHVAQWTGADQLCQANTFLIGAVPVVPLVLGAKRSVLLSIMSIFPCLTEGYWAKLKGAGILTLASLFKMDFVLSYIILQACQKPT